MNIYENSEKLENGLYRFREAFNLTPDRYKRKPLTEETLLVEGQPVQTKGAYTFKIWELDKRNLNNRIYTTALAEKVVTENKTTLALADHPSDDGSVRNIWAVQKNPRISEGWLVIDAILVGAHGQLVEDILEAEGYIGVSSSALGELNESTGEVMVEGFELERYGDHVINPSNNFHNTTETAYVTESMNTTGYSFTVDEPLNYKLTIIDSDKINEKEVNNMDINKKILEMNLKDTLKTFHTIENPKERMKEIQENFVPYFNESELPENSAVVKQFNALLEKTNQELEELTEKGQKTDELESKLQESTKIQSDLEAENAKLKEQVEELTKQSKFFEGVAEETKRNYVKVQSMLKKQIAISNTKIDADEYVKMLESVESKSDKDVEYVKTLEEKVTILTAQLDDAVKHIAENTVESKTSKRVKESTARNTRNSKTPTRLTKEQRADLAKLREARQAKKAEDEMLIKPYRESTELDDDFKVDRKVISAFVADRIKTNPELADIKESLLKSKTLEDAQARIDQFEAKESASLFENLRQKEREYLKYSEGKELPSKGIKRRQGLI